MKLLLTPANQKVLKTLDFSKTLFAFDFDGTLSKISPQFDTPKLSKKTSALLQKLSSLAPVAIISGRSVADLKSRLSFEPQFLIGNHGLEGLHSNLSFLKHAQQTCAQWAKTIRATLKSKKGYEVEDKTYSLAVHYRHAPEKLVAKLALLEIVSRLDPNPRVVMGKSVINLLPPGAPHKGVALVELMAQSNVKHAFYIGDDDTDEDVFGLPDERIFSARVGFKKTSRAQFLIFRLSSIAKSGD